MDEQVEAFLRHLIDRRGLAANTTAAYRTDLEQFGIFLRERSVASWFDVTHDDILAFLLFLRNETNTIPHVYFGWSEGNPLSYLFKYVAFGEGDTAPITHEVLRQAEKNPERRPTVHVGG